MIFRTWLFITISGLAGCQLAAGALTIIHVYSQDDTAPSAFVFGFLASLIWALATIIDDIRRRT
jgi:uncharacterized membrane protein